MPSVKRIETTSADGFVVLETGPDGSVTVAAPKLASGTQDVVRVCVPEVSLIEAVLEYAHERGLRRARKPKTNGAAKTRTRRAAKPLPDDDRQHDPAALI